MELNTKRTREDEARCVEVEKGKSRKTLNCICRYFETHIRLMNESQ